MNLRNLIFLLVLGSSLLIVLTTLSTAYHVQREALINGTLEDNQLYASRLAKTLEHYLQDAQHALDYMASRMDGAAKDPLPVREATRQLQQQNYYFNSVFRVDATGHVISIWPGHLQYLESQRLDSPGNTAALTRQQPLITPPYMSNAGNLIVQMSCPIRDALGHYLGYLGGSIYLHDSPLQRLIDQQPFQNGAYVYVVSTQGQLIYHPEPQRIGEFVPQNPVVQQLMQGKSGSQRLINTRGIDMLAGYVALPSLGWGIVVQRPTKCTLTSLDTLMQHVIDHTAPLFIVVLLPLLLGLAHFISRPLRQLADNSLNLDSNSCIQKLQAVSGWYYEAQRMKQALLQGIQAIHVQIQQLKVDANQDVLTGLSNRRGLELALNTLTASGQGFSAIALDIDFFKQVNDAYGHTRGDQVLQDIAQIMRLQAKGKDTLCRTGGEEFLILLPQTSLTDACTLAEQLRHEVETCPLIPGHPLSISLGVASYASSSTSPEQTLMQADQALYTAKRTGRNRVVCTPAEPDHPIS
mgnify:CR=1 FL=1